jgi:hypothetical protein|tara:strand:- start:853 stop:1239 length:387 start_codon:yes stop_codon:yes gene_type:complete
MMRNNERDLMNNEMTTLLENIKEDYLKWTTKCSGANNMPGVLSDINKKMIAEFNEGISYKAGTKYIKITRERNGVWGFVVNTDKDKKFKKGDLLMAAGYNAPARNHSRGNILDGGYKIEWTGPRYINR